MECKGKINTWLKISEHVLYEMGPGNSRIHILLKCIWPLFRIDHMLGHKISLNKFQRTKFAQIMFSNYNGVELEINNKNKLGNS